MKREKSVARRAIRMKSELEIAIYDGVMDAAKQARLVGENPIEWYARERVFLGLKTFQRRLATGDWSLDELERIQRDLRSARIEVEMKKRFTVPNSQHGGQ